MPRPSLRACLAVLLLAAVGCTPTIPPPTTRVAQPRALDPAASGPAVDLAREMYPRLAAIANAFESGDRSAAVRRDFDAAAERCQDALAGLNAAPPGESDDGRRRRHFVVAGCRLLAQRRADHQALDHTLGLFALALGPTGAPLPAARQRV